MMRKVLEYALLVLLMVVGCWQVNDIEHRYGEAYAQYCAWVAVLLAGTVVYAPAICITVYQLRAHTKFMRQLQADEVRRKEVKEGLDEMYSALIREASENDGILSEHDKRLYRPCNN